MNKSRYFQAVHNAKKSLKHGDRVRVSKCQGTKRYISFECWDGDWIVSKSGIDDYHPVNVDMVNGEAVNFAPGPKFGQIWIFEEQLYMVCGNCCSTGEDLWIIDLVSGVARQVPVEKLTFTSACDDVTESEMLQMLTNLSLSGHSYAMWFLGSFYEGKNYRKSTWYYVAALRADPVAHRVAFKEIITVAYMKSVLPGLEEQDVEFLNGIPEIADQKIGVGLWEQAIRNAEAALYTGGELKNECSV